MKIRIVYETGDRSGQKNEFEVMSALRLGRHPDNDLVFDEPADRTVSAFHAEIRCEEGRLVIMDSGSTNGILLNGQRVHHSSLGPGDVVELGSSGPAFRVDEAETAPPSEPVSIPPARQSEPTEKMPPPSPPKKYGTRTVGMLVQRALQQAGVIKTGGTSKSTDYFETMVENKMKMSSTRVKRIVAASLIVFALSGAALAFYVYRNRSVNVYQTTEVNYGDFKGGEIAQANRFAIFLLAGQHKQGATLASEPMGFCTAFAIARDILATNAHCIERATSEFANVQAIMNGAPANRFGLISTVVHPGYRAGQISPDVGLVKVQGLLPKLVTIADTHVLERIAPGIPMFLYGFPGRLNRIDAPEATFVKGDVGRVTTFEQRLGNFGQNTLLQHSAYASSGTSGSPIFNTSGQVIGINAGGYTENGRPLTAYNFAMRIDLINTILPLIQTR